MSAARDYALHCVSHGLVLVELVVGLHGRMNLVVLEKIARRAGILCQYKVSLAKDAQGTHGYILKITYRCRYNI